MSGRLEARWGAAAIVVLAVLLGFAGNAFAHASLLRSSPNDGGMVAKAPARFELTFDEPVSPLVLKLVTPAGSAISLGKFIRQGDVLSVEAPPELGNGTYALSWRVVSADGHPVGGAVVFSIGAPSAGAIPDIENTVDWPVRIAFWTAKLLLYAGLFIGVGGAFFMRWVGAPSRHASQVCSTVMLAGIASAAASLGLQGADALDASLGSLGQGIVWQTGFATSYGNTVALAVGALLAGMLALWLQGTPAKMISLAALIGAGAALAASGHASTAAPQCLTRPAVFLHAAGIAFWAGAVVPLGFALASGNGGIEALRRFSRIIPFALFALVAAGAVLAVVQLRSLDALWATAYGNVFLIKLALLTLLFALAALNRFRLTRPAANGEVAAIGMLRRSILMEIVLFLAIFGVAAYWRFTPPPRTLAEAAAEPASTHIHTLRAMADLTMTPGRAGPVTASIIIMTGEFGPLSAKAVTLTLTDPAAGIAPITRPASQPGDGTWQVATLPIPAPGRWSVRIDILVSDAETIPLDGEIDIRR